MYYNKNICFHIISLKDPKKKREKTDILIPIFHMCMVNASNTYKERTFLNWEGKEKKEKKFTKTFYLFHFTPAFHPQDLRMEEPNHMNII